MGAVGRRLEDALTYLPRKKLLEFKRAQVVYDVTAPSAGIYLVIQGRVKVTVTVDNSPIVMGIFSKDDFFGDIGLIGFSSHTETATAMERTSLMNWTASELEEQTRSSPNWG